MRIVVTFCCCWIFAPASTIIIISSRSGLLQKFFFIGDHIIFSHYPHTYSTLGLPRIVVAHSDYSVWLGCCLSGLKTPSTLHIIRCRQHR